MVDKINKSIKKFKLNLLGKTVLTEAASGNYVVTPIIAAVAGAKVIAITKKSKYASVNEVIKQTSNLAKKLNVEKKIIIVEDKENIEYENLDIVTNTGFVRPIDKNMINKLSNKCVIPLMWEPWEYRKEDLDLNACMEKTIKVYGTNESDSRLKTMSYIGYIVMNFLLNNKMSPFSSKILILGSKHFTKAIIEVLEKNHYSYVHISNYSKQIKTSSFQAIVIAEHQDKSLLIGENGFLKTKNILDNQYIIHICGNVDFKNISCKVNTDKPASFGYMSFTTDYIDNQAVIDLHTAGLKVAEGMLVANEKKFTPVEYKNYMEKYYCALAFKKEKYW
jgi:hypothetical protein